MAQRVNKNIEIVFLIFIIIMFIVIINRYFGFFHIKTKLVSISKSINTDVNSNKKGVYLKYEKEAGLIVKKNSNEIYGKTQSVPILLYHGVVKNPRNIDEISIDTFQKQMFLLKKNGYQTITMMDFYEFVKNDKQLPKKSFMITFDDGRKDSYYPTDPILAALNYNAVMFVITRHFKEKSNYYLSVDELKSMLNTQRWEIESHGKNDHDYIKIDENQNKGWYMSNKMWLNKQNRLESDNEYHNRILNDLRVSKEEIKTELGNSVIAFALPAGDYGRNKQIKNIVINSLGISYPLSFFQFRPEAEFGYFRANYKNFLDNAYFFRRIKITRNIREHDLLNIIQASADKNLPYADNFENEKNWINGWGEKLMDYNGYTLKSEPKGKSAGMYLDGSYLWKDYQFSLIAKLINGSSYSLEALTSRGKTFVGCNYSNNKVKIYRSINGVVKNLGEIKMNNLNINLNENVGILVSKDYFHCTVNENKILKATYEHPFTNGSVAIKVFAHDADKGAELDVKNIYVKKNKYNNKN